jgi:hypothetical protein
MSAEEVGEKLFPVPFRAAQTRHELTRARTRSSTERGRHLTAWAMARLAIELPSLQHSNHESCIREALTNVFVCQALCIWRSVTRWDLSSPFRGSWPILIVLTRCASVEISSHSSYASSLVTSHTRPMYVRGFSRTTWTCVVRETVEGNQAFSVAKQHVVSWQCITRVEVELHSFQSSAPNACKCTK